MLSCCGKGPRELAWGAQQVLRQYSSRGCASCRARRHAGGGPLCTWARRQGVQRAEPMPCPPCSLTSLCRCHTIMTRWVGASAGPPPAAAWNLPESPASVGSSSGCARGDVQSSCLQTVLVAWCLGTEPQALPAPPGWACHATPPHYPTLPTSTFSVLPLWPIHPSTTARGRAPPTLRPPLTHCVIHHCRR